mmetsp:Transcript_40519/g.65865  ORF Transcript_40519/g.65865 Transcript_40519/m.65865 type:complete len:80 (+) Transcript_40519:1663-1902(+)
MDEWSVAMVTTQPTQKKRRRTWDGGHSTFSCLMKQKQHKARRAEAGDTRLARQLYTKDSCARILDYTLAANLEGIHMDY